MSQLRSIRPRLLVAGALAAVIGVASCSSADRVVGPPPEPIDLSQYLGGEALQQFREGTLDSLGGRPTGPLRTSSAQAGIVAQRVVDAIGSSLAQHWSGIPGIPIPVGSLRPCGESLRIESPYEPDLSSEFSRLQTSDFWVVKICSGPTRVVGVVAAASLVDLITADGQLVDFPPVNSIQWDAWRSATPPVLDYGEAIRSVATTSRQRVVAPPRLVASPGRAAFIGDWWMQVEAPSDIRLVGGNRVASKLLALGVDFGKGKAVRASWKLGTSRSADTLRGPAFTLVLRRRSPYDGEVGEVIP